MSEPLPVFSFSQVSHVSASLNPSRRRLTPSQNTKEVAHQLLMTGGRIGGDGNETNEGDRNSPIVPL